MEFSETRKNPAQPLAWSMTSGYPGAAANTAYAVFKIGRSLRSPPTAPASSTAIDSTQRELRGLTRTRTTLIDQRSASVQSLQKVLEDANLKLSSVATDVFGASGRAILEALPAETTDPAMLAEPAKGRLRKEREELEKALARRLQDHHRLLVGMQPRTPRLPRRVDRSLGCGDYRAAVLF